MPQEEARDEAIRRSVERLAQDLADGSRRFEESVARRCEGLGLPSPAGGAIDLPLFGEPARLELSTLALTDAAGAERSQTDRILLYHYLLTRGPVAEGGEPISFRDFAGGAFYWNPFLARTGLPLARKYGRDLALCDSTSEALCETSLRSALARFDWSELRLGDFGARIHGFGNLYLILVGHAACEGIEAEFNVLFEPAAKRAFGAEDAAAFASRICLGLI